MTLLYRALALQIVVAVLLAAPSQSIAETVPALPWGANGPVTAIAKSGNTLYIGGGFTAVGPCTGGGVPVDPERGQRLARYPRVAGTINVALSDGRGGWYAGGDFTGVGGEPRRNLAHIFANGVVDAWAPDPDGPVYALSLRDEVLLVAGAFTHISANDRPNLAAFSAGAITPWNPTTNGAVRALVWRESRVFIGGDFSEAAGAPRAHLACIDMDTGQVTAWDPGAGGAGWYVRALALGGDTLYVGGFFGILGGAPREMLGSVNAVTGVVTSWTPNVEGTFSQYDQVPYIASIAVDHGSVYVAGHYLKFDGELRGGVAKVDEASGVLSPWNPVPVTTATEHAPYVWALSIVRDRVYLGGRFGLVGGEARLYSAAVDAATGAVTPWDPRPDGDVYTLAPSDNQIYVGGGFSILGEWVPRRKLAALDVTTGTAMDWRPAVDFWVGSLAATNSTVLVGGSFTLIAGVVRNNLAALDSATGGATPWDPSAESDFGGYVETMLINGGVVYVGGEFSSIGGQARENLAAIDLRTGLATEWNPGADGIVKCLALRGSHLYVGGSFTRLGGAPRNYVGAVDTVVGAATTWDAASDGAVSALVATDDVVYVGGAFEHIGGQPRTSLAALDAESGLADAWNPRLARRFMPPEVNALAISDGTLYVGGSFDHLGAQERLNIAALDALTGDPTTWSANGDGSVLALHAEPDVLYAGGVLARAGTQPASGLATLTTRGSQSWPAQGGLPIRLGPSYPNPTKGHASIPFELARAGSVWLEIYDLQGRLVADVLHVRFVAAGAHEAMLDTSRLRQGIYLCRLRALGATTTQKIIVLGR